LQKYYNCCSTYEARAMSRFPSKKETVHDCTGVQEGEFSPKCEEQFKLKFAD